MVSCKRQTYLLPATFPILFSRPLNDEERSSRSVSVVSCPSNKDVSVQEKLSSSITKKFNFDRVFCERSKQVLTGLLHSYYYAHFNRFSCQSDLYATVLRPDLYLSHCRTH